MLARMTTKYFWEDFPVGQVREFGAMPVTRDAVQNIYLRRTEKIGGRYQNTEFETYPMVKNPTN